MTAYKVRIVFKEGSEQRMERAVGFHAEFFQKPMFRNQQALGGLQRVAYISKLLDCVCKNLLGLKKFAATIQHVHW